MKTRLIPPGVGLVVVALGILFRAASSIAAEASEAGVPARPLTSEMRIGIFDSRAVAYARFWSEAHQRELRQRAAAAEAAKAASDEILFKKLSRELQEEQRTIHLQVFSTASVDDILATMADHVKNLQREIGFTRLVSKWDKEELARVGKVEQVDVTLMLVAYYSLPEKRARALTELLKHEPLSLPVARDLADRGQL